jgi:hypothetical protein
MSTRNSQTETNTVLAAVNFLSVGATVFFSKTEEYWDKPFVMKRHHTYETRSVILKGVVKAIKGNEFKAMLIDNNGFEKDGEEFVFHKDCLLCNQNFTDLEALGRWTKN